MLRGSATLLGRREHEFNGSICEHWANYQKRADDNQIDGLRAPPAPCASNCALAYFSSAIWPASFHRKFCSTLALQFSLIFEPSEGFLPIKFASGLTGIL